jgi:MFS family permease
VVTQSAAALVSGIGIGRFAFTPILPLMIEQTGLSPRGGAIVAATNYFGYFVGATLGIALPRLVRFGAGFRWALIVQVASLAAMPLASSVTLWSALRCVSGIASAAIFMTGAASLLAYLPGRRAHLAGWGYSGVGAGIVASGLAVALVRRIPSWTVAWEVVALLAALAAMACWTMCLEGHDAVLPDALPAAVRPGPVQAADSVAVPGSDPEPLRAGTSEPGRGAGLAPPAGSVGKSFAALAVAYTLEGAGYVIAGTFLVAAIDENSPGWVGSSAWVIAGLAAVPSCAAWTGLTRRFSVPALLASALAVQAMGIALPAVFAGPAAAIVSALLFGATFMGAVALTMAAGRNLAFPRAVAILTAGYALGQIAGPALAGITAAAGYRPALALGAVTVLLAAIVAAFGRRGYPAPPARTAATSTTVRR